MKFTKETWRRALRTFIQAAVSYIAVNLCVVDFASESDVLSSALIGLGASALAAGIAAVMNMEKPEVTETEDVVEETVSEVDEVTE